MKTVTIEFPTEELANQALQLLDEKGLLPPDYERAPNGLYINVKKGSNPERFFEEGFGAFPEFPSVEEIRAESNRFPMAGNHIWIPRS